MNTLKLKLLARQLFLNFKFYVDPLTPVNKLDSFFKTIQPITTEHELIRLGGNTDSGYLVPNDLNDINFCFSPGVSNEAFFEEDLSRLGIKSFLADYSVESPPSSNPLWDFEKKYLGTSNDEVYMTLEKWIETKAESNSNDMILQMDIEGSEYEVLFDTSKATLNKFRIIVVEFHELYKLLNPFGFKIIKACFDKLLDNFEIVHIHPNNCFDVFKYKNFEIPPVMEFTFLRKDRIKNYSKTKSFPHRLDKNNTSNKKIILPECWYAK
jgi:hypothetical protein